MPIPGSRLPDDGRDLAPALPRLLEGPAERFDLGVATDEAAQPTCCHRLET